MLSVNSCILIVLPASLSPLIHPVLFNQPMGPEIRWKFPRQKKKEKQMESKWYRRDRAPDEARPRSVYGQWPERFAAIRLKRLEEEEPDHMDLRPCRFRRASLGGRAWMTVSFYDGFTAFEAACAGSIC